MELPGILVSPRQGPIIPDVAEQGVTFGGHPYHRHPHSRPGSRPPSRKHENIRALAQAHPARPGVHRVPWSPAHPFLGHRRCRGLLAALRPALRRTGRAGRCSWHGHHLLAVRALPESGPEHVAGCSWRGPQTPVRHLSVLAHSAAEGWACGAAARDRGTLSLCAGPPPSEV